MQTQRVLLEVLSAVLVVVGILMLGFAPELVGIGRAAPAVISNFNKGAQSGLSKFWAASVARSSPTFQAAARAGRLGNRMSAPQGVPQQGVQQGMTGSSSASQLNQQAGSIFEDVSHPRPPGAPNIAGAEGELASNRDPTLQSQASQFETQQQYETNALQQSEQELEEQAAHNPANPNNLGKPPLGQWTTAILSSTSKTGGILPTVAGMISIGLNKPE